MEEDYTTGYLALAAAMILDAVNVYHQNTYACNVGTNFASPKLEALTFLHSPWFEDICTGMGLSSSSVRYTNSIPDPTADCVCEWCRVDYSPEARVVSDDYTKFSFSPRKKHHVSWERNRIKRIIPHSAAYDNTFNATQYLKQLEKQDKENNE